MARRSASRLPQLPGSWAVVLLALCVVAPALAQTRTIPLSPDYKRARLRALLEQWEARLPVVEKQVDVATAKVEELGPQLQPAKVTAETARRQTVTAREARDALIDRKMAEYGAAHGLDDAEAELADAERYVQTIRERLIAELADDADYKARQAELAEAEAQVDALKRDPDAEHEQRLAAVAGMMAAGAAVNAAETERLNADADYAAAQKRVDDLRSAASDVRLDVLRRVKQDEQVELAEQALRDAQRAAGDSASRYKRIEIDFRVYRTRLAKATQELAQLEHNIAYALSELDRGVLPAR